LSREIEAALPEWKIEFTQRVSRGLQITGDGNEPPMIEKPSAVTFWQAVGSRFLPFADAASHELPLARLLRLALFQVSVGIATVLLNGTLNRVLIVELDTPTWMVALMIAIPLLVAPFRALIGHKSDRHRSVLGWRRVPYIWFGTLGQFGGLAIMPFSLILVTRPDTFFVGVAAACLSFLLTGAGMHVTQTAGLAHYRYCSRSKTPSRRGASLCHAARWHDAGGIHHRFTCRFHRDQTHSGCARRRSSDDGSEYRCFVETRSPQPYSDSAAQEGPSFAAIWHHLPHRPMRSVYRSQSASGLWRLPCRMRCLNLMAVKYWVYPWALQHR
jgi:hypothetical protein